MPKKKSAPEVIEDNDLDAASGGLLPAVQKVPQAASSSPSASVSEIVVTKSTDSSSTKL